jgi:hypothetical protein
VPAGWIRIVLSSVTLAAFATLGVAPSRAPEPAPAAVDPVIAAAGDIACDPADSSYNGGAGTSSACRQRYTSDLLLNSGVAAVLALGDNVYNSGSLSNYNASYGPSWGRVKGITRPVLGNHEGSGGGYFDYFNGRGVATGLAGTRGKGYYSFDVGSWHLVAINSNCTRVPCGSGSAQEQWLRADLAAHRSSCTLAYWHHPRFSSGYDGSNTFMQPIFKDLYAEGADVVLSGHSHDYERFAPQDPNGRLDQAKGIRQFVVGTGGAFFTGLSTPKPNSEVRQNRTYGVLRLALHATSYEWRFQSEGGKTFTDSGSALCHHPSTTQSAASEPASAGDATTDDAAGSRRRPAGCTLERWAVRTLSDLRARRVNFHSRPTSVRALARFGGPASARAASRRTGVETTTYRLRAKLRAMKLHGNGTVTVVVADRAASGRTMIIAFPSPRCHSRKHSLKGRAMRRARAALVEACGRPPRRLARLRGVGRITGVGFFSPTRPVGAAKNGIQLEPVLRFSARDCRRR